MTVLADKTAIENRIAFFRDLDIKVTHAYQKGSQLILGTEACEDEWDRTALATAGPLLGLVRHIRGTNLDERYEFLADATPIAGLADVTGGECSNLFVFEALGPIPPSPAKIAYDGLHEIAVAIEKLAAAQQRAASAMVRIADRF